MLILKFDRVSLKRRKFVVECKVEECKIFKIINRFFIVVEVVIILLKMVLMSNVVFVLRNKSIGVFIIYIVLFDVFNFVINILKLISFGGVCFLELDEDK